MPGVWFHIGLGNDDLMEKLGALKQKKQTGGKEKSEIIMKKKKYEEPSAGSHYTENSAGLHIPMYPSLYSWARFSAMWEGVGECVHFHVHTRACDTWCALSAASNLNANSSFPQKCFKLTSWHAQIGGVSAVGAAFRCHLSRSDLEGSGQDSDVFLSGALHGVSLHMLKLTPLARNGALA